MEKPSIFERFRLHFASSRWENSDAAAMADIVTRQIKLLLWFVAGGHLGLFFLTLFLIKQPVFIAFHLAAAFLFAVFSRTIASWNFYLFYCATFIVSFVQSFMLYLVYGETFSVELYLLLMIPVASYALLLPSRSNRNKAIFILLALITGLLAFIFFSALPYVYLVPQSLSLPVFFVFKIYYIAEFFGISVIETYFFTRQMVATIQDEKAAKTRLSTRANFDALTGLYNRYKTNKFLVEAFSNYSNQVAPLSVCMADIDHFKEINDTYGHNTGDFILKTVSQIMNNNIRKDTDFLGRWGGEEFLLVMPATQQVCFERAEVLRRLIQNTAFEFEGKSISVTLTFGVASASEDTPTPEALIDLADQMLYKGKKAGRNRTVSYGTV